MKTLDLEIAGEMLTFTTDHALFWPKHQTLILSDLHLGKAETFQQNGLWLPSEAQDEDLARVTELAHTLKAREILILGDLIHTARGMTESLIRGFSKWSKHLESLGCKITVTIGNHDRNFHLRSWPESWAHVQAVDALIIDSFLFRHEPVMATQKNSTDIMKKTSRPKAESPIRFAWHGHLHPMLRIHDGISTMRLPCFYLQEKACFLPAFSSLAGGENIQLRGNEAAVAVHRARMNTFASTSNQDDEWIGLIEKK